jgi:hypothetical protein
LSLQNEYGRKTAGGRLGLRPILGRFRRPFGYKDLEVEKNRAGIWRNAKCRRGF